MHAAFSSVHFLSFHRNSFSLQNARLSFHGRQNRTSRSVFEALVRLAASLFGHFNYEAKAKPTKPTPSARFGKWLDLDGEFLESGAIAGDLCDTLIGIHPSVRLRHVANVSAAVFEIVNRAATGVHGQIG